VLLGIFYYQNKAFDMAIDFATYYGFAVEIIQDRLIKNRSYDFADWAADFIGSSVGIITWSVAGKRYVKK
jgi:VanZ family protein